MAKKWCNHCYRLVESTKLANDLCEITFETIKVCPFCGAMDGDLFSVKKCKISLSPGAKHGDYIGYPEKVKE